MGDKSAIQWTDATWNPLAGCSPVSGGCRNCYAAREAIRLAGHPNEKVSAKYAGTSEMRGRGDNRRAVFTGRVNLAPEVLDQPLRWKRPRRIFVNSMSDLFHEDVPDEFIARVWWVMGQSAGCLDPSRYRGHIFQILTKRPERMSEWLRGWSDPATRKRWVEAMGEVYDWQSGPKYWPDVLPGVWLGTSVEDQATANERIPHLLATPAAVRFLSCEPLLGGIDLDDLVIDDGRPGEWHASALHCDVDPEDDPYAGATVDWVIVGGESGPNARPMHPGWVRSLRDQCESAGVAFSFKQWGEYVPYEVYAQPPYWQSQHGDLFDGHGFPTHLTDHPTGTLVDGWLDDGYDQVLWRRVGKRKAGRELDGRTWDGFPR